MSHLKQAKDIMARLNQSRKKDPTVFMAKKKLEETKDDTIKERVAKKELTEVDRFLILRQIEKCEEGKREKNKRDAEERQKQPKVKEGKVRKTKNKVKNKKRT